MAVKKQKRNTNRPANKRYLTERRWETNKKKKAERHARKHPNDKIIKAVVSYKRVKSLSYWEKVNLKKVGS